MPTDELVSAQQLLRSMEVAREATNGLYQWLVDEESSRRSPGGGYRPLLWHYGHLAAFEEWWLLMRLKGESPLIPQYQLIFDPIKTPREDSGSLPPRSDIEVYAALVREKVTEYVEGQGADEQVLHLVLEHEYQHQETIAYLLQMLDPGLKLRPSFAKPNPLQATPPTRDLITIPGGPFILGASPTSTVPFIYDNEQPAHKLEVPEFRIDRYPVTNSEYAQFIEAGGYKARSAWSEEGWAWKEANQISRPNYWSEGPPWMVQGMFETAAPMPDAPVTGVSWYEAEAYARFTGRRLPGEIEWEKAATWREGRKTAFPWGDEPPDDERCNFNSTLLGTTPVGAFPRGASGNGCEDMAGNVWEWTASTFAGYPGFKAFPYPEYSELWFDGDHRVLKGGSWMTRGVLLRCSFRNFFRPGFRIAFAGFRCAAD
jgi:gamma-glutamyl hercynylcysteine S-oxide synthase